MQVELDEVQEQHHPQIEIMDMSVNHNDSFTIFEEHEVALLMELLQVQVSCRLVDEMVQSDVVEVECEGL